MTSVRFHVLLLVLGASTVMAAPKVCKIEAFGKLTTFYGDTYPVEIPCRYRLAEMTCGVYNVKVTVKSDFVPPANKRFSPEAVRVQISYDGNKYVAYTNVNLLTRAAEDTSGATSPWTAVTSDLNPGFAGLEDGKVKVKKGPAIVTFSSDRTVEVTCNSGTFTGAPIDQALCGENKASKELQQWKRTQFGPGHGVSNAQAVHYLVLNAAVLQSPNCEDLANTFQGCGNQKLAATTCEPIFGQISMARELGQGDDALLTNSYLECLQDNCGS